MAMMNDPSVMMNMMQGNFAMMVPQMVMMGIVNYFFSGFVLGKIPFPLTPCRVLKVPLLVVPLLTALAYKGWLSGLLAVLATRDEQPWVQGEAAAVRPCCPGRRHRCPRLWPRRPSFKGMLQRGVNISSLDTSYVTSMSWYFLVMSGMCAVHMCSHVRPL